MTGRLEIQPLGDSAILIRIPGAAEAYPKARALADAVAAARLDGVADVAAAYDTVALYYEYPLQADYSIVASVLRMLDDLPPAVDPAGPIVAIRVRYDGPDLEHVANATNLSRAQLVELHSDVVYTAQAVGFVPGFAYLGDLDPRLRVPRRSTPRPRVHAGSVGIAGQHTAVYPFATPGGWHLIGRTEQNMFDITSPQPALITVGTRVRFEAA